MINRTFLCLVKQQNRWEIEDSGFGDGPARFLARGRSYAGRKSRSEQFSSLAESNQVSNCLNSTPSLAHVELVDAGRRAGREGDLEIGAPSDSSRSLEIRTLHARCFCLAKRASSQATRAAPNRSATMLTMGSCRATVRNASPASARLVKKTRPTMAGAVKPRSPAR